MSTHRAPAYEPPRYRRGGSRRRRDEMHHRWEDRHSRAGWWVGAGALILVLVAGGILGGLWWQPDSSGNAIAGQRLTSFPEIGPGLDERQARVVAVLEQEFARPGDGPDYAEGVSEPWCADFLSWVLREAAAPLSNPHSGSWRIPGVSTLQEYYESQGRFVPAGAGYVPRVGDAVVYDHTSPFSQHVNIVLVADAGTVTTIGGNERDEVRIHRFDPAAIPGVVGFGRL